MSTTVKDNQSLVVEKGNRTLTIKTGDETKTVETGNLSETICKLRSTVANQIQVNAVPGERPATQLYEAADDIKLKVGSGTIQMTQTSITLSFGGSRIKMDGSGITLEGGRINLNK
jgi:type VI secretion system secreted protein VgrG